MPLSSPYIPDFSHFAIDEFVAFVVSALLAIMVNAEGQAFAATAMGDKDTNPKKRFHFNAFLHLDLWGAVCFALAGFGWPKFMEINSRNFSMPRLYIMLTRLGGAFANFLLASIAGSIVWVMTKYGLEDRVFNMAALVNTTMAVYGLIPLSPLAGSGIISALFLSKDKFLKYYHLAGPFILVGIFLVERVTDLKIISSYLNPLVAALFNFIISG